MTCGIYAIRNLTTNKVYVGKSINIESRFSGHKAMLRSEVRSKDCNRYLYNAFNKYGEDDFVFEILEEVINPTDDELTDLELSWMIKLKSTERSFGYNLRMDSSTKCFVHEDTKKLISENNIGEKNPNYGNKWSDEQKLRASEIAINLHKSGIYSSEETRKKHSVHSIEFWKNNPEKKKIMAKKVSDKKTIYRFLQYTKEGILVKEWSSMLEIIEQHPDYHDKAIYGCCSGTKKSYKGFIWKKSLKEEHK
ncbi:MAG: GIY-YIG nuclease family protein [Erysipelotrichaceae bacterium]